MESSKDVTIAQQLQKGVDSFPFWYHRIELPHGIVTPGFSPIDPKAYGVPEDLSGKRVLDVGAWDGYWTFEALKRGAREVVAIDNFSDFLGNLEHSDRRAWETFDFCRDALGYSEPACQRFEASVYDVSELIFGRFDVVFCFGTLYHLRHPLLALDILSEVCDGEIYVESAILDDYSAYQGGLGHGYSGNQLVMEFYPGSEYGSNSSNYWSPTLVCLANMIASAGFSHNLKGWKLTEDVTELSLCRGFVSASKPPRAS
jgi:tRNA (mo5U34)-methyltransferase